MSEIMILIVAFATCYAIWDIFICSKTKTSIHTKEGKIKFNPDDYRYRIKEEKYESGIIKFFPQWQMVGGIHWHSLSLPMWGFNNNGKDWCDTIEDSREVINRFRDSLKEDKLVKETNHKY